jgi:hypothetical protein
MFTGLLANESPGPSTRAAHFATAYFTRTEVKPPTTMTAGNAHGMKASMTSALVYRIASETPFHDCGFPGAPDRNICGIGFRLAAARDGADGSFRISPEWATTA